MVSVSYSKYLERVPNETSNYIKWLLDYLYNGENVSVNGYKLYNDDRIFYYALKAYVKSDKVNGNYISSIGFNDKWALTDESFSDSTRESTFRKYAAYFLPDYSEELEVLRPEDIILKIYEINDCSAAFRAVSTSKDYFISKIRERDGLKKEDSKNEIRKNLLSFFPISTINYFDMAGKLFYYLREKSAEKDSFNEEQYLHLSLLLAIYYYKHVSFNDEVFSDKEQIIESFNKIGLTKNKLEKNMKVIIDEAELSKIDSTLIINGYYKDLLEKIKTEDKVYVAEVLKYVVTNGLDGNDYFIKDILGKCGVTIRDLSDLNEIIEKRKIFNGKESSLKSFYKYLSPEVLNYLREVARYYSYLEGKYESLNSMYVTSKLDQMALAMFITNMQLHKQYNNFFTEHGITLEKVLELMNLPKLDVFNEEVKNCVVNENLLLKYDKLLTLGFSSEEDKRNLTVNNIVSKFTIQSKIGSTLVKNIFDSLSDNKLKMDYVDQINEYFDNKEAKRKKDLEEKLFANVPIDVYNYLKDVCSYFELLKGHNLSEVDHEQLAIILGASRYKSKLNDYLESMGLSRDNILSGFNVNLSYEERPFDIDLINTRLRPYIFDREDEKISVYSIFANAFNPKLVNSIMLRKVIDHYSHKDCTYFMDIEKRFKEYDGKSLLNYCIADAKVIIETAVKIYDAIIDDKDKYNLLETEDDVRELAILLSFFKNNDDSIRFFQHNGVDLDSIISIVGLPSNILDIIDDMEMSEDKIVEFKKYINYFNGHIGQELLLLALLSDVPNKSQLLEVITELRGSKYEYLVQEIKNKKERDISAEEGYEVLVGEVVEEPKSLEASSISSYGNNIAKHTNYINKEVQVLTTSSVIDDSISEINTLLKQVQTEEKKDSNFMDLLFGVDEPVKKEINYDVLNEVSTNVDTQIEVLAKELDRYFFIQKYIEECIRKNVELLDYLKNYEDKLLSEPLVEDSNNIIGTCQNMKRKLIEHMISSKIQNIERTLYVLMEQYTVVNNEINNHHNTILSLELSRSAIIPLILTENIISKGIQSERVAIELNANLVDLLSNVINKNNEEANVNLKKIMSLSNPSDDVDARIQSISDYLALTSKDNKDNNQNLDDLITNVKKK